MKIPVTHCQSCAELLSIFNTTEGICRDCATMFALDDQDTADILANQELQPEFQRFTALEKYTINKVIAETIHRDIEATFSLLARLIQNAVRNQEFTKAAWLRDLRNHYQQRITP